MRILLILGDLGPGDALRFAYCGEAVRRAYPKAEITLLVDEEAAAVFLRSHLFDRIVESRLYRVRAVNPTRRRIHKVLEMVRLLLILKTGYDKVITPLWGARALDLLARLVGREQYGSARSPLKSPIRSWDADGDQNAQNLKILETAGIDAGADTPAPIHGPDDDAMVDRMLASCGLRDPSRLLVVHVGSDWACQQWLPDRWAEFLDALLERHPLDALFTGLQSEAGYIESIRRLMSRPSVSVAGATDLHQLGALVARAHFCVSVDSVVFELTKAAGVRAVVLAGPSEAGLNLNQRRLPVIVNRTPPDVRRAIRLCQEPKFPLRGCQRYTCPHAGLRDIRVADVLAAAEAQLATVTGAPA